MRSLSAVLLFSFLAFLLAGCGSKERSSASSSTESYDVVSEGDASGVASTINGPGELTPPTMTATNVDTTTNLAITGQPTAPTATSGSLAGALPTTTAAPAPVYIPPSNPPIGIMRRTPPSQIPTQTYPPVTSRPVPAQPTQTVPPTETAPPPPTTTQPPPTDTTPTDTTRTDTTGTDTTQPQVPAKAKPDQKKKDEPPPPPPPEQTDTTTTNPG